jgi:hypothetical protein
VGRHSTVSKKGDYNAIKKIKNYWKTKWINLSSTFLYLSDCFSIRSGLRARVYIINSGHYVLCLVHTWNNMEISNKSYSQKMKWALMLLYYPQICFKMEHFYFLPFMTVSPSSQSVW